MWPFVAGIILTLAVTIMFEVNAHRSIGDIAIRIVGGTRAAYQHAQATAAKLSARIEKLKTKLDK